MRAFQYKDEFNEWSWVLKFLELNVEWIGILINLYREFFYPMITYVFHWFSVEISGLGIDKSGVLFFVIGFLWKT